MGLFRRRKKTFDTKPVPGRDDLVAISEDDIAEFAQPLVLEIARRAAQEIPEDISPLFGYGTLSMGRAHGWDLDIGGPGQLMAQTAARYGFVTREVELSSADGELPPNNAALLLDLYEKQEFPGQPGFIRSINTAIGACNLPTDSEPELNPDLYAPFPGWPAAVRRMIGQMLVNGFMRQAELNGDRASMPEASQLYEAVFYGYMIHIWSELDPEDWLEGIDEL